MWRNRAPKIQDPNIQRLNGEQQLMHRPYIDEPALMRQHELANMGFLSHTLRRQPGDNPNRFLTVPTVFVSRENGHIVVDDGQYDQNDLLKKNYIPCAFPRPRF